MALLLGLFFRRQHLPVAERDRLLLAALGSPDPSGLQLNGVGGGISSTSKVALISSSEREGYDVDYLIGQVDIKERRIDWEGASAARNLSLKRLFNSVYMHIKRPWC